MWQDSDTAGPELQQTERHPWALSARQFGGPQSQQQQPRECADTDTVCKG